jgi:hypothetical protein
MPRTGKSCPETASVVSPIHPEYESAGRHAGFSVLFQNFVKSSVILRFAHDHTQLLRSTESRTVGLLKLGDIQADIVFQGNDTRNFALKY